MTDEEILKTMAKMIQDNNNILLLAVKNLIQESEIRIKQDVQIEIKTTQQDLTEKIRVTRQDLIERIKFSQEDTCDVVSELLNIGYNIHEARIQRVEDELHLPPLKH